MGQDAKKWSSVSELSAHNTQETASPSLNTPLQLKFNLVGSLACNACQEKTMTFDGAQLPQTFATIPIEFTPKEDKRYNLLYKYEYIDLTVNSPTIINDQPPPLW
jgi:hypothetical protein